MSAVALDPHTARKPRGCVLRALGFYSLFLLCTVGVWIISGHLITARLLRNEYRAWTAVGSPMESLRERYPTSGDSRAAQNLDLMTQPLGFRIISEKAFSAPTANENVFSSNSNYVRTLTQSTDDSIAPLPRETSTFLRGHRSKIDEIADFFFTTKNISWKMDLHAGLDMPLPSLIAHRHLHTLLLVSAIDRQLNGDIQGVRRLMEAAWRHHRTIASRPEFIPQLFAIALANDRNAFLRCLPDAGLEWSARLEACESRKSAFLSWQIDAYGWLILTEEYRGAGDINRAPPYGLFVGGPIDWIVRALSVPYVRFEVANISRYVRRGRGIALLDDTCSNSGQDIARQVTSEMRRWNFIAKMATPSMFRSWSAAVDADFDSELTLLVLEARERMRRSGTWGDKADVQSKVCRCVQWHHRIEHDGKLTIHADPAPGLEPYRRRWTFTISR